MRSIGKAFLFEEADYHKLGLNKKIVEAWEDGMRTNGKKGNFEWWYFDVTLENGNTLVIVFYTKNMIAINTGIKPFITISLTDKEGKEIFTKAISGNPLEFSSSLERCDVKIRNNKFFGDLREYHIEIDESDVKADLTLKSTVDNYRPGTGFSFFKHKDNENYFAWLPAVPHGNVTGTLKYNNKTVLIQGSGYHDHNWGDAQMTKLLHHWYWGRAEVGPYTVINAHMVATPKYSSSEQDVFILFKDGKLVAEDPQFVSCTFEDVYIDNKTKKPVANTIIYNYIDHSNQYRITYKRLKDISCNKFIDFANGISKLIGRLIRFDGAYIRFAGTVTIEHIVDNELVDKSVSSSAVWELMYFGHVPKA